MKKIYFFVLSFCFFNGLSAQIVNIPDEIFRLYLLGATATNNTAKNLDGNFFEIDANRDGQIQLNEALQVSYLFTAGSSMSIQSLEGISSFKNLETLYCNGNSIEDLTGVYNLTKLKKLTCGGNSYDKLDFSSLINLEYLSVGGAPLTSLNLYGLLNLKTLDCNRTNLITLDLSSLINLQSLDCSDNYSLRSLFIKNGSNENYLEFINNPNLRFVCVDESQLATVEYKKHLYGYDDKCVVDSYCSFTPGGLYYTIKGNQKVDYNFNGCDASDFPSSNFKLKISDGNITGNIFPNESGDYNLYVKAGTHIITPILENPNYFVVSPAMINVTFPAQSSPFIQNFCIVPNGLHPDLEVVLLPTTAARPGFDAVYKIIYKNKGNALQSGSVNLKFNDAVLDLVVANPVTSAQTINNLSWNFSNLKPFETREITFRLNVNSPMETPAVNSGSVLPYTTTITSATTDETPIDNTFTLNQTVVGSFDPNDKTCLEGDVITPGLIGEYVHYLIRFENTGNYAAQNIVVKDMIDLSKFDISTLVPTDASHSYITKISEGNKVEFIFENVNLPFDDVNNDGYIAFKIKTKSTLKVGDSFDNEANIYFDYNFPVLTNKASSKFGTTLGTQDFEFSNYFKVYPIPTDEVLNISAIQNVEIQSIAVYDILGQMVLALPNIKDTSKIDVSNLSSGNYFIKIKSDKGSSSMKFIKN